MRAAISFDHFLPSAAALTMVNLINPPRLAPPTTIYRDYFYHIKTDTFCERHATVLAAYSIDPAADATAAAPTEVARLIYAAAQDGVPTAFLQQRQGTRGRGTKIALLNLVSIYLPRMELLASPCDNLSFALNRGVSCGAIACAYWQTASIHQIESTVHVLTYLAIDTTLA